MTLVRMSGVSKRFGRSLIFSGVDLEVEAGRIHALVGPNGSGKSVLLKLMCGLALPTDGTVDVDSRLLSRHRTFPEGMGVCIDGPSYVGGLSAVDNLRDLARIRRQASEEDIARALDRVDLHPGRQRARNFSLGMKQKLSLAQAIMEDPELLILDEPFNGLDAESVERVRALLEEERERGTSVVFTSHNSEDIARLADVVYEFSGGTVRRRERA